MIHLVVRHLREHNVPFRLASHPAPEPLPAVAPYVPVGGMVVETQLLFLGGKLAVACIPAGEQLSLPALRNELRTEVMEGNAADLPPPFASAAGPFPPLGTALGILTVVDQRVTMATPIVFAAFSRQDYFEIPFDEFARLERPRIASFAVGGELPEGHEDLRKAG